MRISTISVILAGLTSATGCTMSKVPPSPSPSVSADWQKLNQIEAAYESWRHPLALAVWNQRIGTSAPEREEIESSRRDFFFDKSVDTRLAELIQSEDPEVVEVARAWSSLRTANLITYDEQLDELRISIERLATGGSEEPSRMTPVQTLYTSSAPAARQSALEELEVRFERELLPLLAWRAERLDELASQAGHQNYLSMRLPQSAHNPHHALEAMCSDQLAHTQPGWDRFVETLHAKLGRAPTHADYLAEAVRGTNASSQFLATLSPEVIATDLFGRMGFDINAMNIQIVTRDGAPGGSAHAINPPHDVRLEGLFAPGYDGTRGYLHELGHAVHLKSIRDRPQPFRQLPGDLAIAEGIAEVFVRGLRDPVWLNERFPELTEEEIAVYLESIAAFDAYAVREYCLLARVEVAIHQHRPIDEAFHEIYEDVFGTPHSGRPFYDLVPYLSRPLYSLDYVVSHTVTRAILNNFAPDTLLSPEVGKRLQREIFAAGNTIKLDSITGSPKSLVDTRHSAQVERDSLGIIAGM